MAKISFANAGAPVAETEAAPQDPQNPRQADDNGEPVNPSNLPAEQRAPFIFNEDDVSLSQVKFPKLNLVQKSGTLANVFTPGEFVFNQQIAIYTPPVLKDGVILKQGTEPLFLVAVGFRKDRYSEQVPFGGDEEGLLLDSLQEVAQAGGTLNQNEHKKKVALQQPSRLFKTLATCLFLVRKPKDVQDPDHILFPFVCEDERYVLATYDMKGGSFSNGAEVIRNAKKIGHLQAGGYPSFSWTVGTLLKNWQSGNSSFIPVFKPGTKTSDPLRAFIKNITGS